MIHNPVVMDITVSGSDPVLQSKSVSPSESKQTVTPDAGYDGLSSVSVSAIQTETKTVTTNGTVTPSSGKYLKQVTVNVPSSGVNTSDATATAGEILKDKTAYVKGEKVTGTLKYYPSGSDDSYALTGGSALSFANSEGVATDIGIKIAITSKDEVALLSGSTLFTLASVDKFGDATASDVAEGKTFTSASGLKVTGTHVCSGGINTSDATATADDMAEGVTAYVKGEKITGNVKVFDSSSSTILSSEDRVSFTVFQTKKYIQLKPAERTNNALYRSGTYQALMAQASFFGDATASDVAEGKTFTSTAGLKVTGTAKASAPTLQSKTATPSTSQQTITPDNGYDGLSSVTVEAMPTAALGTPTISVDSAGKITATVQQASAGYVEAGSKSATKQLTTKGAATITPGTSDQTIASGTYLTGAQTIKGDANLVAGNIKSGVSIFGVAGSFAGSGGGGSSDNNCEAYHITSASDVLSFKGTGTVKVWGYGSKKSNYTTTVYAFVGDGYYAGSSYGTPSKTSASFSINADGTLSGLPSGLTAVDLLVTIGV